MGAFKDKRVRLAVAFAVGLLLLTGFASLSDHQGAAQAIGQPRVVAALGAATVQGEKTIVEVIVVVPSGADAHAAAQAALAGQGARPLGSDEFSTNGLAWNQFSDASTTNDFVTQNYNPANQEPGASAQTALTNSQATWTNVTTSSFAFNFGGTTTRCPSLVRECRGPQFRDGFNDVAWLQLSGCCTLGVTWFTTSDPDEADVALNTAFSWFTDGRDFDAETVFLHENGHVAGLGHSDVEGTVMEPTYAGVRRALHPDDINGITFLYPATATTTGGITGIVTDASTAAAIAGATVSTDTGQPATTAADGSYTLIGVPMGDRTVTASASGYSSASQTVAVTDGDTATANFSLSPATTATIVSVSSITYGTTGGKTGTLHLLITVALMDNLGNPVAGASVSIDVLRNGSFYGSGTGTTGTDGTVTFQASKAPCGGTYTTTVTNVSAAGLTWDGDTPANSFTKC